MRRDGLGLAVVAMASLATFAGCAGGTGGDKCNGVVCTAPAPSCDGDVAVTYSGDGVCDPDTASCSYAAVLVRTDCTTDGQVCRNGTCVTPDPCEGVSCDAPPAATCDGDVVVSYESTGTCTAGTCSYAEAGRVDCTPSSQICQDGACVDPGPCYEVACESPPAPVCDGNDLVAYEDVGTCDEQTGECGYAEATRTDCTLDGGVCLDAACVNACVDVTCDEPPTSTCDGNVLVGYVVPGTCDPATGVCAYEEDRTDCGSEQVCSNGACAPGSTVLSGDLVIDEVMTQPYIAPELGQWFEVHNATDRTLDLTGLTFTKDPADPSAEHFTIPAEAALTIAPRGYLVLGPNCIQNALGHTILDYAYGTCDTTTNPVTVNPGLLLQLQDRLAIVAADGSTVVDEIAWDGGPVWPTPFSASMQLADDPAVSDDGPDFVDNADGAAWCPSRSVYYSDAQGPREFRGTPGQPNEACIAPVTVSIYQIQDKSAEGHPDPQTPVRIEGVSLTWHYAPHIFVEETAGGEYSGIVVDLTNHPTGVDYMDIGDLVNVEGYPEELYGATRLKLTRFEARTGEYQYVPPEVLELSVLDNPATAEPWEKVLVEVRHVGVVSEPDVYGVVHLGQTLLGTPLLVPVDEFDPQMCSFYSRITGLVNYRNHSYELLPNAWHGAGTPTAQVDTVQVLGSGLSPSAVCVPRGTSVTWESTAGADVTLGGDFALTVPAGGSASHYFNSVGTFAYDDGRGHAGYVIVHF